MKKRINLAIAIALGLLITCASAVSALVPLNQLSPGPPPVEYASYISNEAFPTDGDQSKIKVVGADAQPIFWHFVITEKVNFTITVKFTQESLPIVIEFYKQAGNGATHYGIITPRGYSIENAWVDGDGQFIFNLSHVATTPTTTSTTGTTGTTGTTSTTSTTQTTSTTSTTSTTQTTSTTIGTTPFITTHPTLPETGEGGQTISFPLIGAIAMGLALVGGITMYTIRKSELYDNGESN